MRVKRTRSRDPLAKGAFTVVDLLVLLLTLLHMIVELLLIFLWKAYRPWAVDDVDSAVCSGSFAEQVLSSYFKPLDCEEVVSVRIEDIVVTDVQLDNSKLVVMLLKLLVF